MPDRKTSELYTGTPAVKGLKSLAVNGESVTPTIENGYAVITREWKSGDRIELELPMVVQRIKADENLAADRGLMALRYGPLIYNVERADQPEINQTISPKPLTTEWRGDLLEGVRVIKGYWADGSPLVAIPNYARNNRLGQEAQHREGAEAGGGDSSVNYAPGSTASATAATTNALATAAGQIGARRGRFGEPASVVWIKDQ